MALPRRWTGGGSAVTQLVLRPCCSTACRQDEAAPHHSPGLCTRSGRGWHPSGAAASPKPVNRPDTSARGIKRLLSDKQAEGAGCHAVEQPGGSSRLLGRRGLTGTAALRSVMAFTKLSASGVAERMLSTRPSWNRRMDALS